MFNNTLLEKCWRISLIHMYNMTYDITNEYGKLYTVYDVKFSKKREIVEGSNMEIRNIVIS